MKTRPRMASTSPVFDKLYSLAELATMPTRKRKQYELSLKHYWDLEADKDTTRNRLKRERAEGREEGRAEGRAEERIANARKLIEAGMPEDIVLSTLGLKKEDLW